MIHFKSSLRSTAEIHNQNVHPSSNYVLKSWLISIYWYSLHIHLFIWKCLIRFCQTVERCTEHRTTLIWEGDPRGTCGVFDHILNKNFKAYVANETNCRPFKILNVHSVITESTHISFFSVHSRTLEILTMENVSRTFHCNTHKGTDVVNKLSVYFQCLSAVLAAETWKRVVSLLKIKDP